MSNNNRRKSVPGIALVMDQTSFDKFVASFATETTEHVNLSYDEGRLDDLKEKYGQHPNKHLLAAIKKLEAKIKTAQNPVPKAPQINLDKKGQPIFAQPCANENIIKLGLPKQIKMLEKPFVQCDLKADVKPFELQYVKFHVAKTNMAFNMMIAKPLDEVVGYQKVGHGYMKRDVPVRKESDNQIFVLFMQDARDLYKGSYRTRNIIEDLEYEKNMFTIAVNDITNPMTQRKVAARAFAQKQ